MKFGIIEAREIVSGVYFLREHSSELDMRNLRDRRRGVFENINPNVTKITLDQKKNGDLFFEGPFGIYDEINLNDRRYKKSVMEEAIERYNDVYVTGKRAVSELGHPDNSDINLHLVSHVITEPLELRENNIVWGRAKVLPDFPMGDILYKYLKEGLVLGVSSRGLGDVEEVELDEDKIDGEKSTIFDVTEFELSAFDAVWEPSIGKFVEIVENESTEEAVKEMKRLKEEELNKILKTLMG